VFESAGGLCSNQRVDGVDCGGKVLRPTLFDPSKPEISGFDVGKKVLPARVKKAGNTTNQIIMIL
jgi:hypothetical protein